MKTVNDRMEPGMTTQELAEHIGVNLSRLKRFMYTLPCEVTCVFAAWTAKGSNWRGWVWHKPICDMFADNPERMWDWHKYIRQQHILNRKPAIDDE